MSRTPRGGQKATIAMCLRGSGRTEKLPIAPKPNPNLNRNLHLGGFAWPAHNSPPPCSLLPLCGTEPCPSHLCQPLRRSMLSLGETTDLAWSSSPQACQPVFWNCLGTGIRTTTTRLVMGAPGGLGLHLPSAQVMVPGSWD